MKTWLARLGWPLLGFAGAGLLWQLGAGHLSDVEAINQAFSPQALLGRFEQYRRSGAPGTADEGWAWDMYQHYYRELTSARQQGFDKLFHQVYAQAYDQAVRQQQGLI